MNAPPFAKEESKHLNCQSRYPKTKRKAQVEWPGLFSRRELVPLLITVIHHFQHNKNRCDMVSIY
jgi:hypothetical protein